MHSYLLRDNNRIHGGPRAVKDTKTIDSAYDRYLQSAVIPEAFKLCLFSSMMFLPNFMLI